MNLYSIENISKSYSEKILFRDISLGINEGDKIGIIGINGTGKSTLLKVIAGKETTDSGRIMHGNSVRCEYLPQNPQMDFEATVLEQLFKGDTPLMRVLREYESILDKLNLSPEDKVMQSKLMELSSKMDALGAWAAESEAKTILTKLGVSNFDEKIKNLSGGQRKRIALAATLITESDLLILDEPTNHLDNDTIEWLEAYLFSRKGALLMVTHDRYFLDRVTNRIIELDRGKLYTYTGNYSDFLEAKEERLQIEEANESKRQNLLRKELAWIKRGAKARSTKQKARIDRFEKLSEENNQEIETKVHISTGNSRLGRKVVEIEDISKYFNNRAVIKNFSYIVLRDDRIGIVGANGSGKSTLMNIISQKLQPDEGKIEKGETVKIGYYSQENRELDSDKRVIEYIREGAEYITTNEGEKVSASQMLERFLFPPAVQWTQIGKLSGGEKRRLYLLRVLMDSPNVLLLDEPTNDLDIETLTILEDYISDFNGAVISVSHDRYFLDKTAEKIFVFEGDGKIVQYTGNYSGYHDKLKENSEEKSKENIKPEKKEKEHSKDKKLKFSYKEKIEFDEIEDVIGNIEASISEVEEKINNTQSDYELLQKLISEKEALQVELSEKLDRWTYLSELWEKIEEQKK